MEGQKNVREIQQALEDAGYTPGKIDGMWGRLTISALRSFQRGRGLKDDGILGPATLAALFNKDKSRIAAVAARPPWMSEAIRLINTKEFLGDGDNPTILDWAENIDIQYEGDDTAWCGLFVGHCIASTLPQEPLPGALLRAKAWLKAGIPVSPRSGAIMVFWRDGENSGRGHVGFYAGENEMYYFILGGNQENSVCYKKYPKERFIAARWPKSAESLVSLSSVVKVKRGEELATLQG